MKRRDNLMKGIAALTVGLMGGTETRELVAEDITQVHLSTSTDFGRFHEREIVMYDRLEDVNVFADMIRNADEAPGVVNMVTPEYDVEVRYTSGEVERYYVWLGESGKPTSLMNLNDTNTVYQVSTDITDRLIQLLDHK